MQKLKLYLYGPMSGLPFENHPAFNEAAETLRALGHEPLNPAENGMMSDGHSWTDLMRKALVMVAQADGGVALDGWQNSRGAQLENLIINYLGMPTYRLVNKQLIPLNHANHTVKRTSALR